VQSDVTGIEEKIVRVSSGSYFYRVSTFGLSFISGTERARTTCCSQMEKVFEADLL
jgi:hypothetical protein